MENIKSASKVFLKTVAVTVLGFFVAISFMVMCTGFGTENIGYTVYGATENDDELKELYTHYFSDGEDEREEEFKNAGYAMQKVSVRSELSGGVKALLLILTQVFNLAILIGFIYYYMWELGSKDYNLIKFGHTKTDNLKGIKIGLMASVPNIIFFALLVIFKNGFMSGFNMPYYKFIVSYLYSFVELIIGGVKTASELNLTQIIGLGALLLVVPIITEIAYLLGVKGISVGEKLIYKKGE